MPLARAEFENLNETEIRVEPTRVQCAMLEYQLGLKTASIQGAVKTSMCYGYQHILSGVAAISLLRTTPLRICWYP